MPKNRVIRSDTARQDPATTQLPSVEPRTDPFPVVRLDVPDERTPLFDALYAIHGLGGRHALNTRREAPMGNWYQDHTGKWTYDDRGDTESDRNADGVPDDEQTDPNAEHPEAWIGATRDLTVADREGSGG